MHCLRLGVTHQALGRILVMGVKEMEADMLKMSVTASVTGRSEAHALERMILHIETSVVTEIGTVRGTAITTEKRIDIVDVMNDGTNGVMSGTIEDVARSATASIVTETETATVTEIVKEREENEEIESARRRYMLEISVEEETKTTNVKSISATKKRKASQR